MDEGESVTIIGQQFEEVRTGDNFCLKVGTTVSQLFDNFLNEK